MSIDQLRPVTVKDMGGPPMVGIRSPAYVDAQVLAAGVAESHTVPTGAKYVLFSATAYFYVNYTTTAAVPGADVIDGTGCELNPVLREISDVTTISLISPSACIVTMAFFK